MTDWVMTVVDSVSIQPYIFGSNNLKHIVGASQLVYEATHDWVHGCLVDVGKTNVDRRGEFNDQRIEEPTHGLTSELVYAGGGNAVAIFKAIEDAQQFTRRLTEKALMDAPGLQIVVVHQPFAWGDNLAAVRRAAFQTLDRKKRDRRVSSPLLGLGVTADCQFTGLSAVTVQTEGDAQTEDATQAGRTDSWRISAEIRGKRSAFSDAHARLGKSLPSGYDFAADFDDFGDKGESSYIAIIHTDGNGMGKRIETLEAGIRTTDFRAYIQAMRQFSASIQTAAETAMDETIKLLIGNIDAEDKIGGIVTVHDKKKLPFRPIVFGGDDTTFVCDGRLALTLAEAYLRRLTTPTLSDNRPLTARAGVAVVNSHYPFARAYGLAEELAGSVKQRIKKAERDMTAMDWHFAVSGLVLDLDAIRRREYTVAAGNLVMRPVALDGDSDWRTWDVFTHMMDGFRGTDWVGRRNKLKALREALRGGTERVKEFTQATVALPEIDGRPEARNDGWIGRCCVYYDAVEALDFYVPLKGPATGGAT